MSSVVALDKSGTYDCLLLSIGRIRPLMRGQYRRWVSAGAGRSQPLSPVPENCTGYYRQVRKDYHRYSEHRTFCLYVNPSAATRQKVIRNKAVRFPSLAGIVHTAPMGPTGNLRRKNLKAGSARSRAKGGRHVHQDTLADDSEIVRRGIRQLLSAETEIEIVGEAADFAQTVQMVSDVKPEVIVLDLHMPGETNFSPQAVNHV
jgi:hypothetical protein